MEANKNATIINSTSTLSDGIILLGSESAQILGFTSDKFGGYLWKDGNAIIISLITSHVKGNFKSLIERIRSLGFAVKIPTPLGRMEQIVIKNGYRHEIEISELGLFVDMWILDN